MKELKNVWHEPLLHFILIGAALFLLFAWTRTNDERTPNRIVVSASQVEQLTAQFKRTWLRPPTERELAGLIESHVRDEVYYREALALGLDRDDRMVRQRMRQKLEFLLEDLSVDQQPNDVELQAFLERHAERFRVPARVSFQQVYLNPDKHEDLDTDAAAWLGELRGGAVPESLDDMFMLDYSFDSVTPHEIRRLFGGTFAEQVVALEPGEWQGPLDSGLGLHLVRVHARVSGRMPSLDEVRSRVETEWLAERRQQQKEAAYQRLREDYEVVVERDKSPDPVEPEAKVTRR